MATSYNFDEAYSTDSFTDSDWEAICDHLGIDFTTDEGDEKIVHKHDVAEGKKSKVGKKKRSGGEKNEEGKKSHVGKKKRSHGEKNEEKPIEKVKKTESGKGKKTSENTTEEKLEESEMQVSELRKDMKRLRKTLKKGRVQLLLNWKDDAEIRETYKEFKDISKIVRKNFKALLHKDLQAGEETNNDDKTVEAGEETNNDEKTVDVPVDAGSRPKCVTFQGCVRYSCPSCDYVARSKGRAYSHMVDKHNAMPLGCEKCSFTTKNPTSLHNHKKLYCAKRDEK